MNGYLITNNTLIKGKEFWGTVFNPDFIKPLLKYQSIAKVIKKPVTTVIELVEFAFKHTITPLKFIPRTDKSSHSSTLSTYFLNPRSRNPLIYHRRKGRS